MVLYGGIIGVIIIGIIMWLFKITITLLQVGIILFLIAMIAVAFFAKEIYEKNKLTAYNSKDEMVIARDHAVKFWAEKTNGEIISDVWYNRKYFHPFYLYCFLMRKVRALESDKNKEVWIIVSIEKKHPKIVSVTDEVQVAENVSESIEKRAERIWKAFNPHYSGTPTEGIRPEQSDYLLSKKTPERKVNIYHTSEESKKQSIMDNPPEEDD